MFVLQAKMKKVLIIFTPNEPQADDKQEFCDFHRIVLLSFLKT